MDWAGVVRKYVDALPSVDVSPALIQKLYHLLDLTSLNDSDTESSVAAFLENATSTLGHVAAVCVYPAFVRLAAAQLSGSPVKVATVANFPAGKMTIEDVLVVIGRALTDGAQEIDVVFPYQRYLRGERHYAHTFVEACKAACGEKVSLKVILETGVLKEPALIADASFDVLMAGADMIKTSTGKVSSGATLEAAATMLLVIKELSPQLKRPLGFKVAGGVRDIAKATQYLALADMIMGREWVSPSTFRIGASQLLQALMTHSGGNEA